LLRRIAGAAAWLPRTRSARPSLPASYDPLRRLRHRCGDEEGLGLLGARGNLRQANPVRHRHDADIFAANVKAKNIDLTSIDFVVLSHRHSITWRPEPCLSVNPTVKIYAPKEGFGIYGSSLPSSFYRKGRSLAARDALLRRQAAGSHEFGTACSAPTIELIDKTTEIAPALR
jgi:hypothetical protein